MSRVQNWCDDTTPIWGFSLVCIIKFLYWLPAMFKCSASKDATEWPNVSNECEDWFLLSLRECALDVELSQTCRSIWNKKRTYADRCAPPLWAMESVRPYVCVCVCVCVCVSASPVWFSSGVLMGFVCTVKYIYTVCVYINISCSKANLWFAGFHQGLTAK